MQRWNMHHVRGGPIVHDQQRMQGGDDVVHDGCVDMQRVGRSTRRNDVRRQSGVLEGRVRCMHQRRAVYAGQSLSYGDPRVLDGHACLQRQQRVASQRHRVWNRSRLSQRLVRVLRGGRRVSAERFL